MNVINKPKVSRTIALTYEILPLGTVNSVEKILIPFGIRLFGASFHGGYYHIPSLGRAFLCVTNFKDGLLIKTSHGNYVITPNDPLDFKETIENRKSTSRLQRH